LTCRTALDHTETAGPVSGPVAAGIRNTMSSPVFQSGSPGTLNTSAAMPTSTRLEPLSIVVLSAWCGLGAGLLEVAVTLLRKTYFDPDPFYGMSSQFVWLVPVVDLLIFSVAGLLLAGIVKCAPKRHKVATRALATLALLVPFCAAFPRIYGAAALLLTMGVATKLVPVLERRARGFRQMVHLGGPLAIGVLLVVAASCWAKPRLEEWREASQPLPPPNSPNILLIVLDTVGAGHLGTLGYSRPTSPTLEELASRGISFNRARAPASWTLPSHASMFTGRWPHELSTGWFTALDRAFPTVAEYLGAHGYATAGFVSNTSYCAYDSGLARGFTTYRDFHFPALTALHVAVLVKQFVHGVQDLDTFLTDWLDLSFLRTAADLTWQILAQDRKPAGIVSSDFLDWLAMRRRPDRPFFAFLNYYDVHNPYQLSPGGLRRFGAAPSTERELAVVHHWPTIVKHGPSPGQIAFARDSYDDCVANLDEDLGLLLDALERRGALERTWVIVTSDHGESFGEHPGLFLHGATLFQTECHVPLVIVPPRGARTPKLVTTPVSLRDMAATIVDISGLMTGSPFPGASLAGVQDASANEDEASPAGSPALAELANEILPYTLPAESDPLRWPLAGLIDGDWSYFRREAQGQELLFDLSKDPGEQHDRAGDPAVQPVLDKMRKALYRLTNGPLTPDRFRR
jgi:arylsulfatase A-like enzyme